VLWALALVIPSAAGCKFNFDPRQAPGMDAPIEIDAATTPDTPPPLPVLACGTPSKFSIDNPAGPGSGSGSGSSAPSLVGFAGAASDTGYYAFAVDNTGKVHGFAFGFDGTTLASRVIDTPVYSGATGAISATATSDGVLASIVYGAPDGTALVPLDAALAPRGVAQTYPSQIGAENAIARLTDGTLAFLSTGSNVTTQVVATDGVTHSPLHGVTPDAESPHEPTMTASDTGFLVAWSADTASSPSEIHARLFDKQFATVVIDTTAINPAPMFAAHNPRVAYAAKADRYLFTWWHKTGVTDEVWVGVRDNKLKGIAPQLVSSRGKFPRVVAGDDYFLLVWQDLDAPSGLGAARVKFNGDVEVLAISGDGGVSLGWDVVTRAGQPALIWLEDGAKLNAWFDPLCG